MKKIFTLATAVLLMTGAAFAGTNCGKDKKCCKDKTECKKGDKKDCKKDKTTTTTTPAPTPKA